jgi:hypothetical protein
MTGSEFRRPFPMHMTHSFLSDPIDPAQTSQAIAQWIETPHIFLRGATARRELRGGCLMTKQSILRSARQFLGAALLTWSAALAYAQPARAEDPDEGELRKYYNKVDVWHFHVAYSVRYNDQDVVVTRDLSPQPPIPETLCYIRFDLLSGTGDYAYGFKPASLGGPRKPTEWGVYVHKRGNIFNQLESSIRLNVIYFYVGDLKEEYKNNPPNICGRKQAADTPQAGHTYKGEWSDLVVRGKLVHGWPQH